MTTTPKALALTLSATLEDLLYDWIVANDAAAELRRQHGEIAELRAQVEALTGKQEPAAYRYKPASPFSKDGKGICDYWSYVENKNRMDLFSIKQGIAPDPLYAAPQPLTRTAVPDPDDSLLLCVSDLQHSAIYDNHAEMQSCIRSVADRIKAFAASKQAVGPAVPEGWRRVMPGGRKTDEWESARVADFNAGWNQYRKVAAAALEKLSFDESVNVKRHLVQWLRNNYQDYSNISSLCDALLAAPQPEQVTRPAVPEGWRLVPVEPTTEMKAAGVLDVGDSEELCLTWDELVTIYRAMLAAAPQPDQVAGTYNDADMTDSFKKGYELGLRQVAAPQSEAAQPEPLDTPQAFREAELKKGGA